MDTYFNLTLKSTFMLKWLRMSGDAIIAPNSYILKVDDDVFVNPNVLRSALHDLELSSTVKKNPKDECSDDEQRLPESYLILGRKLPERLGERDLATITGITN